MGVSLHVEGIMEPTDEFNRMLNVWRTCRAADVPVPKEVDDFFQGEEPDSSGMRTSVPVREWSDDCYGGYELLVKDIPEGVTIIRVMLG